jgi:hypothetical protein
MNRVQVAKVIVCFALVFGLGGITGWLLKPAGPSGPRQPSGERLLQNLDFRFGLTDEQKAKLLPLLLEWEREARQSGFRPRRRVQIQEKYTPRIREVLTPSQQLEFDLMVREARDRLERRLRPARP